MNWKRLIKAGLLGFVLAAPLVTDASAQSVLRVMRGATSSSIKVAVNRAIVMESDRPFAELSVANPNIADIATLGERTIYVLGKTPGLTTLTILGPEGELITNVDVAVSPDLAEFKERLRSILPREPIEVRTAADGIILSGTVSGSRKLSRALELAERYAPGKVTNLMMVGGSQQVMLKVRFAEMSREISKSLGTNLGATYAGSDAAGVAFGGDGLKSGVLTSVGDTDPSGGGSGSLLFDAVSTAGVGFSLLDLGDFTVNFLLEALESKGMVRTLAEPNLVAISGETADFLAGGEFPFPVDAGDGVTAIEFKPFGVSLNFTPTVIDDDLIRLEIDTEVSSIQTFARGTVEEIGLNTRNASTSVEMRDGQSFAIAGLLQDDFTDTVGQVPWLGDVPILGALFRSTSYTRRQSELVIIITPYLVTPTDGDLLAIPTDRMRIPNERELFFNGRVEGSPVVRDLARQDFQGSYGYVME